MVKSLPFYCYCCTFSLNQLGNTFQINNLSLLRKKTVYVEGLCKMCRIIINIILYYSGLSDTVYRQTQNGVK